MGSSCLKSTVSVRNMKCSQKYTVRMTINTVNKISYTECTFTQMVKEYVLFLTILLQHTDLSEIIKLCMNPDKVSTKCQQSTLNTECHCLPTQVPLAHYLMDAVIYFTTFMSTFSQATSCPGNQKAPASRCCHIVFLPVAYLLQEACHSM